MHAWLNHWLDTVSTNDLIDGIGIGLVGLVILAAALWPKRRPPKPRRTPDVVRTILARPAPTTSRRYLVPARTPQPRRPVDAPPAPAGPATAAAAPTSGRPADHAGPGGDHDVRVDALVDALAAPMPDAPVTARDVVDALMGPTPAPVQTEHEGATVTWSPTATVAALGPGLLRDDGMPETLIPVDLAAERLHADRVEAEGDAHGDLAGIDTALARFRVGIDTALDAWCLADPQTRLRVVTSGEHTQQWSTQEMLALIAAETVDDAAVT